MLRQKLRSGIERLLGRGAAPSPAPSPLPPAPPVPREAAPAVALDPAEVARVIDERVRPALQADGGDIELLGVRGADAHVRLQGACRGCPGAAMTLRMGVEALLRDEIPGFGRVVAED